VSLYSGADYDVSRIAAGLGGGGHRNAAGFSLTLTDWVARFVSPAERRPG
jgi:nanoRNase/pAp phosphatase (c-di-AMP/oligoRNAs hydrolase)